MRPLRLARINSAGVARGDAFHAGADERSFGNKQRNGLTLHVRAHQSAVRIVMLEERNQRSGDGHELLRRDVDVVDFRLRHENEVALATER